MEEFMNPKAFKEWPTLSVGANSRVISKPVVRIVHIVAPKIIKTDPANFRELVQKLTGNPKKPSRRGGDDKKPARPAVVGPPEVMPYPWHEERIKELMDEESMCMQEKPDVFLGDLIGDVGDFFHGFNDFPLSSSHMDVNIGDAHVSKREFKMELGV